MTEARFQVRERQLGKKARGKETGVVKEDWKIACIIPVYKGRVARGECANYRVYLFS